MPTDERRIAGVGSQQLRTQGSRSVVGSDLEEVAAPEADKAVRLEVSWSRVFDAAGIDDGNSHARLRLLRREEKP